MNIKPDTSDRSRINMHFGRITTARKITMAAKKKGGYKKPKVEETSHKPAKHIVETARLASSVEKAKNPGKVRSTRE
jgi:hypothetical protein